MQEDETPEERASKAAERARQLLARPTTLDDYGWCLVATLMVEADDFRRVAQQRNPNYALPLLDEVVKELRAATSNFTKPDFIRAAKSPRRQRPALFGM